MPEHYKGPPKAPAENLKKMVLIERRHQGLTCQLNGTVDEVVARLIKLRDGTPKGSILILSWETVFAQYPGDEDSQELKLYDERLETDDECRIRLQKEEQRVQSNLAHKRAQLEQLKKELGEP